MGLGSGVIVSAKGLILTNNHVIDHAAAIKVTTSDDTEYDAELVGADPKADLAVLRLKGKPTGLVPLAFGSSSKLRLGEVVLAIGNPLAVGQTVTMGIISAKGRGNVHIADYEDFLQTDAAINPGNSGGALVNLRGELVGINTAIASQTGGYQGIGFAIPSDMASPIMRMLIEKGKVTRGWMGVGIQDVDHQMAATLDLGTNRGVVLTQIEAGSPAAKAGLHRGDVIVGIGGKPTLTSGSLRNAVAALAPGQTVAVEFFRDKQKRTANVTFVEAPAGSSAGRGGEDDDVETAPGDGGKLGLRVAPLSGQARRKYDVPAEVDHGVVVTGVAEDGVAAQLGFSPGDVILEINRQPIKSAADLERAVKKGPKQLAMLVYSDGATVYVTVEK
jgi:serine protease Do